MVIVNRGPEDLKTSNYHDHARMGNYHAVKAEYEKSNTKYNVVVPKLFIVFSRYS